MERCADGFKDGLGLGRGAELGFELGLKVGFVLGGLAVSDPAAETLYMHVRWDNEYINKMSSINFSITNLETVARKVRL